MHIDSHFCQPVSRKKKNHVFITSNFSVLLFTWLGAIRHVALLILQLVNHSGAKTVGCQTQSAAEQQLEALVDCHSRSPSAGLFWAWQMIQHVGFSAGCRSAQGLTALNDAVDTERQRFPTKWLVYLFTCSPYILIYHRHAWFPVLRVYYCHLYHLILNGFQYILN